MHFAVMVLAALQATPAGTHRITIMTPNAGETCTFVTDRRGAIGRKPSLWQSDVIHRKIGNRDDAVDPERWADEIERLHGASAYRMTAVGRCRATNVVVYADSPTAADLTLMDNLSRIRPTGCVNEDMKEGNRHHNSSLQFPRGITVVFALFKKEGDGFYESVLTRYWDREVPRQLEVAGNPCPPPLPQWPPAPPPVPTR